LTAKVIDRGRILAGVPESANLATTRAKAGFTLLKAGAVHDTVIAACDTTNGAKIVVPVIKVTVARDSTFFHTLINQSITNITLIGK